MPIGRFSKMTRLSVKALRHYDQIGLLVPASVDPESSYRYYESSQATRAEVIRTLRSLDMPLDRIAQVLDGTDRAAVLSEHRTHLSRTLDEYERRLSYIDRLMRGEDFVKTYDISIKQVPEQSAASKRVIADREGAISAIPYGFGAVMGHLGANGAGPTGVPFIVYHEFPDDGSEAEIEICIPTADDVPSSAEIEVKAFPGGSMARTIHEGPYDQLGPAYHALTAWMQTHGHTPSGPAREVYLNSPEEVAPEDLRTEILWPVD